ncbi:MAG: Maf family protein [Leptospiraceae bacterium]|nr:septum formation protein Maf [Leptospiraceae bacterium]MCK6380365.1 Maf family protein [Leptospiraceae bacterium]NUM41298.1 septum formation protein Maf [Leptospiraceae bacterium]
MLILKSGSPRRISIFRDIGLRFQVSPSSIDESVLPEEDCMEYLKRITIAKLESINATYSQTLVSSDTIVVWENKIFPKPLNFQTAKNTLMELNGKTHQVYSGLGIFKQGNLYFDLDKTFVELKKWSIEEIENYIKVTNPLDKAGSYGIQDKCSPVLSFQGSFSNVLGFPFRTFLKYHSLWSEFL